MANLSYTLGPVQRYPIAGGSCLYRYPPYLIPIVIVIWLPPLRPRSAAGPRPPMLSHLRWV